MTETDPVPPGDVVPDTTIPAPPHTPIHGTYTSLLPLRDDHAADLFTHLGGPSNAAIWTFLPVAAPLTADDMASIVGKWAASQDLLYYAIMSGPTRDEQGVGKTEAVGVICYHAIFPEHRRLEIAWVVFGDALKRTRQATETFYLLLERAFALGYMRVEWKANSLNAPSLSAAKRLGFTFEGIFRKHWIMKGKRRDTAWFSMIDDDWPAVQRGFNLWLDSSNFDENDRQKRGLLECRES